ncbi:tumor necrosis factor receptor superfamily member 10B-like isoform X1 [Sinocyclocheilus anshuiensis]|uniref:tumor necrosis factor receptor superfamily member 10B-like isoform X1 n=1 Tax=Sinocyclocheilus anshuiensis TaxID=1608454 RepID=UPI0007B8ED1E|nr:PREDICTED: tumor necrosis factor receptor superfamily member 10B-like isoform X1 [Sinocyclocheilus anshuiensis]
MRYNIFLVFLLLNLIHAAKSHLDLAWAQRSIKNRSSRDVSCREGMEYEHDNICCLHCPAGTYVKKACLTVSEKGVCEPCEFDTYTEHDNGLRKCLSCSKCRIDQETTAKCTSTQNTRCKCKQGSFCLPDQACEVCKKCSRCKIDEETVKSCTDISNTVCRKRSSLGSANSVTFIVVVPLIAMLAIIVVIVYWTKSKPSKTAVTSRSLREMVKICMGDSEEVKEEWQNAHNSMIDDSSQLQPFLEQNYAERESLRKLVPLNGEESLKKTFDFFEEMDVHYHNRFFRFIGLSDNSIKSAESLFSEDRIYELLKIWMEKEGLKADFNSLIEALIYLDQRLSAENIIAKAISNGYFKYEDE